MIKGRVGRLEFFLNVVIINILLYFIGIIFVFAILSRIAVSMDTGQDISNSMMFLYLFAIFISVGGYFYTTIKRLHDINKSGLYSLILFIPLFGFIYSIYLFFAKGTEGENNYGIPKSIKDNLKEFIVSLLIYIGVGGGLLLQQILFVESVDKSNTNVENNAITNEENPLNITVEEFDKKLVNEIFSTITELDKEIEPLLNGESYNIKLLDKEYDLISEELPENIALYTYMDDIMNNESAELLAQYIDYSTLYSLIHKREEYVKTIKIDELDIHDDAELYEYFATAPIYDIFLENAKIFKDIEYVSKLNVGNYGYIGDNKKYYEDILEDKDINKEEIKKELLLVSKKLKEDSVKIQNNVKILEKDKFEEISNNIELSDNLKDFIYNLAYGETLLDYYKNK